jgi:nucleoside-diphosphate-sugar epimerase
MQIKNTIALIGGTGKSGNYLLRQLLENEYPVKLLLRDSSKLKISHSLIEVVPGDVRDPDTVKTLVQGSQVVLSTLGQPAGEPSIFSDATRNVIHAMKHFQIRRYVVTTGINVDTPGDKKSGYTSIATEWMRANYPLTTADKQVEWELLQASGLDWTLVRLPLIELTDIQAEIRQSLIDCPGEKINAASLASFMTRQITDKTWLKLSPFIANL